MFRLNSIALACAMAVSAASAPAQDWPQWQGPGRDNRVVGFEVPKTWPKQLTSKWKVAVGDGVATPALVGDKLYVFARADGAETTRCLEAASGKELWKDKYDSLGASGSASGFSGPRASPLVAEGKVVTVGVRGVWSCLDAKDGKLLWRKDDFKGTVPRFYAASSPMLVDGLCVAEVGGPNNGGVVACELASGKEKWRWTGDSPSYSSPVLMNVGGTRVIIAMTDTKIVALGVANGKLLWEIPYPVPGRGYNVATPIVDGTTLIYSGAGRGATAVKLEKKDGALAATELWKNPDNSVMFNSPVLKNGLVFGFSTGNDFFCIKMSDGKTAWTAPYSPAGQNPAPEPAGGRGRSRGGYCSIVDAGSVLIALTPGMELIVFQPSEKAYSEVARIKVAETPTYACPILAGNRLFIKDQDSVSLYVLQ